MKRVLGGCLVLVLIGVVALGVAIFFGYRAARPMFDDARGMIEQAREIGSLSDRVTNTSGYTPPATGELSEAQVRRLLAVHARVRQTLGPRWTELQARAGAIEAKTREGGRDFSFTEVGAMLSGFGSLLRDARSAHVEALNSEGFSSPEYAWVRRRAYEAAGLEVARGIDWSSLEDVIKKGSDQAGAPVPSVRLPEVPERNRELVKGHVGELKDWAPLALLGF